MRSLYARPFFERNEKYVIAKCKMCYLVVTTFLTPWLARALSLVICCEIDGFKERLLSVKDMRHQADIDYDICCVVLCVQDFEVSD